MVSLIWFIKRMKSEPFEEEKKKRSFSWIIDESKCINAEEVRKLRTFCTKARDYGLQCKKFTPIRNWFMVELGLNAGLRVEEMSYLQCGNLFINKDRSSITVTGKGNKKRAIWINSDFKKTCLAYLGYKKDFGYSTQPEDYLLNNLRGEKITKRALQKFFKAILKKANLPQHYYVHCLRHTYTTFLLMASNNNYRFAQQQLGHSSIKTTQIYASVIESEGRKAVERLYKK